MYLPQCFSTGVPLKWLVARGSQVVAKGSANTDRSCLEWN